VIVVFESVELPEGTELLFSGEKEGERVDEFIVWGLSTKEPSSAATPVGRKNFRGEFCRSLSYLIPIRIGNIIVCVRRTG